MIPLGNYFVDPAQVSFVGPLDKDVRAHVNTMTYHFSIVVGGALVRLQYDEQAQCVSYRDLLLIEVAKYAKPTYYVNKQGDV